MPLSVSKQIDPHEILAGVARVEVSKLVADMSVFNM